MTIDDEISSSLLAQCRTDPAAVVRHIENLEARTRVLCERLDLYEQKKDKPTDKYVKHLPGGLLDWCIFKGDLVLATTAGVYTTVKMSDGSVDNDYFVSIMDLTK